VILILTKRQAHRGRAKTAKSGAKRAKTALTTFKKRTLIRDNTVVECAHLPDFITGTVIMTHIATLYTAVWSIACCIYKPTNNRIPAV